MIGVCPFSPQVLPCTVSARKLQEKHLPAFRLRLSGDGRKGLPAPPVNRLRIALVGPLQRLVWGQAQFGEQFSHRRLAQLNIPRLCGNPEKPLANRA